MRGTFVSSECYSVQLVTYVRQHAYAERMDEGVQPSTANVVKLKYTVAISEINLSVSFQQSRVGATGTVPPEGFKNFKSAISLEGSSNRMLLNGS